MKKLLFFCIAIIVSLLSFPLFACTDFRLTANDGTILVTRSMEFSTPFNSNLRTTPIGTSFTTTTPDGKAGMTWKNQYGYAYLDGMNENYAIDGMNTQGLSFEALLFPSEAQYQTVPAGQENQGLPYIMLGDWILGNFKTVDEVRNAIGSVYLYAQTIPGMGNVIFPLHFSIFDKSGKGIVLEYTNGKLTIYDNIGVMTNSPTYSWQINNLRNYVNLSPYNPSPIVESGLTYVGTGQGSGMVGLPGDSTPPSRFVKIALLMRSAFKANTATDELNLAQHIMNNVDIPIGTIRGKQANAPDVTDQTQWVIFKDLTHSVIYYRTYADTTLHKVDLSQIDFSAGAKALKMPIADSQYVIDQTSQFKDQKAS